MSHIDVTNEIYAPYLDLGWTYELKKRGNRNAVYWFDENQKARCGSNLKDKWYCQECGGQTRYEVEQCPRCESDNIEYEKTGICISQSVMENGRCQLHGGKAPKGLAHGRTIHSQYSIVLPLRLAETFQRSLEDEELLSLRGEIGLTHTRIYDLLEKLGDEESGERWRQIKVQYSAMINANMNDNTVEFIDHADKLNNLIEMGYGDYLSWGEIFTAVSSKRRLVETERKRLSELKQTMTAEQAMAMLAFVVSTIKLRVREYIEDNNAGDMLLAAISTDINDFLSRKSY